MATLKYSTTSTSITLWVDGLSGTYAYSRTFEFMVGSSTKTATSSPNATASPRVTFYRLSPNTSYTIRCTILLENGTSVLPTGNGTSVRTDAPPPPEPVVNWSVSASGLAITATINSVSNANINNYYFKFSLYQGNTVIYSANSYSKTRSRTFSTTNINYNTTYTVYMSYSLNGSTAIDTLYKNVTTGPQPISVNWSASVNGLGIIANINSVTGTAMSNCYFKFSLQQGNTVIYAYNNYSKTPRRIFDTDKISYNTTYTVYMSYSLDGVITEDTFSKTVKTGPQPISVNWSVSANGLGITANVNSVTGTTMSSCYFKFSLYQGNTVIYTANSYSHTPRRIFDTANINYNTTYIVYMSYSLDGVITEDTLSKTITTGPRPEPVVTWSATATGLSIYAKVSSMTNVTMSDYYFKFSLQQGSTVIYTYNSYSKTSSRTFGTTNVNYNTTYTVYMAYSLDGVITEKTLTTNVTTGPAPEPVVNWSTSVSGLLITAIIDSMTNVNINDYYFRFSLQQGSTVIHAYNNYSKDRSRTFSNVGVNYNTTYTVYMSYSLNGSTTLKTFTKTVTTGPSPISKWYWSFGTSTGDPFSLTATEWNNFCARINQVRVAKGLSTYSFTSASMGQSFRASIFKQTVSAISVMTTINAALNNVKTGDIIYGWYFDELETKLNNVIDTL